MDDVADDVMLSEYDSETPSGYQSRFESKKWIADAIKNKGSLRRKLHKKAGEKITNAEIDAELSELRDKDKDPNKPGLQLSKRDAAKRKQLVLAKTLKGLKK